MCDSEAFDFFIHTPANILVTGSSGTGKTFAIAEIIHRRWEIMDPVPSKIINSYQEYQPIIFLEMQEREMKKTGKEIIFIKGLDLLEELVPPRNSEPTLLVIDDVLDFALSNMYITNIFTRMSNHRNLTVALLVQAMMAKGLRIISLKSKYVLAFNSPRDSTPISVLGRQINFGKRNHVLEYAYRECTKNPYAYVFIDLDPNQDSRFRVRSSVFPDDKCVVYTNEK